jgi:hypothetical protein
MTGPRLNTPLFLPAQHETRCHNFDSIDKEMDLYIQAAVRPVELGRNGPVVLTEIAATLSHSWPGPEHVAPTG